MASILADNWQMVVNVDWQIWPLFPINTVNWIVQNLKLLPIQSRSSRVLRQLEFLRNVRLFLSIPLFHSSCRLEDNRYLRTKTTNVGQNNDHDLVEIYTGSTCNIALHATSDCLLCTQHIYSALFTEERRCAKAGERINWSVRCAHYIFPGNDS